MKTIQYTNTLYYYDGPQVFEAQDVTGGHYVAVAVAPESGVERYLVAGVVPEQLRQFRSGVLDLRALLLGSATAEWYLATAEAGLDQPLELEDQQGDLTQSEFLPDPGFILHDLPTDTWTLREARERNNLVLEVIVNPPEAAEEHRIRVNTLVDLLGHVQTMVKHAYGAALRELPNSSCRGIDRSEAHLLDVVVPAAAGSFRLLLEAAKTPNMFGGSELARALEKVDLLFANSGNPQQALNVVKGHKGHLAGAYLRFLNFLMQNKTGFQYSWAEPTFPRPHTHAVTQGDVATLIEILSGVSNLGAESVTQTGILEQADVISGRWRLNTGDETVSGKLKGDTPSLKGLKLGNVYKFSCLEEIEEFEGTGREQRTLYLIEYEPV